MVKRVVITLFLLFATLPLIAMPFLSFRRAAAAAAPTGNYIVSGGGMAELRGTYAPDGTANGKTRYRMGVTTYYILWQTSSDPDRWVIWSDGAAAMLWMGYYINTNTSATCPVTTTQAWEVGPLGSAPAPTVTAE